VRFKYDPESGALYIRLSEGRVEETLPVAEGYYLDIDKEGRVLGAEFLSLEEFKEWAAQRGVEVELPDHIEDPDAYRLNLA
jgi:uncharacterized protein YuzE